MLNANKLVRDTILGKNNSTVTPVYGWLFENMRGKIQSEFGSVENFEDKYNFDLAHIFGGPQFCDIEEIERMRNRNIEITPEMFLDMPLNDIDNAGDYDNVIKALKHHKQERGRFCYIQANGIFECLNNVFGIENHLAYLLMYPDELQLVYQRQAEWNRKFAEHAIELGIDMVHISDDWGSQNSLLFSPSLLRGMIMPYHKATCDFVKSKGAFVSLHSDGNITDALPVIRELGYHLIHPWQESAGMSYDLYLREYSGQFAIMGGMCIQTSLGFGNMEKLHDDIRRVFGLLKGKRWVCCTTHFVQEHCSLEELVYAYDLINKLSGK